MIERPNPKLTAPHAGGPWLGANFWSRAGGPDMWQQFDPELVAQELRVLAEHGMGVVRSFFELPQFLPEPGVIEERLAGRFARFLDLCMSTYPVEYLAAGAANVNPSDIVRLYRALAARAGCETPVRVGRSDVHVDRLVREDGVVLTWFVSYADEAVEVRPELADGCVLRDRHTGSALETITLAPRGVAIAELLSHASVDGANAASADGAGVGEVLGPARPA